MKRKVYLFIGIVSIFVRVTIADQLNNSIDTAEELDNEYELYYSN